MQSGCHRHAKGNISQLITIYCRTLNLQLHQKNKQLLPCLSYMRLHNAFSNISTQINKKQTISTDYACMWRPPMLICMRLAAIRLKKLLVWPPVVCKICMRRRPLHCKSASILQGRWVHKYLNKKNEDTGTSLRIKNGTRQEGFRSSIPQHPAQISPNL